MLTPRDRIIQIAQWYLSAFHAGRPSDIAKKPYNPVLGETFRCHWNLLSSPSSDVSTHSHSGHHAICDMPAVTGRMYPNCARYSKGLFPFLIPKGLFTCLIPKVYLPVLFRRLIYLSTSERLVYLSNSERLVSLSSSERLIYLSNSKGLIYLSNSKRLVCLSNSERLIYLSNSERLVYMSNLRGLFTCLILKGLFTCLILRGLFTCLILRGLFTCLILLGLLTCLIKKGLVTFRCVYLSNFVEVYVCQCLLPIKIRFEIQLSRQSASMYRCIRVVFSGNNVSHFPMLF